jgi:RNA polymerase sigma-70 factor (ECF subfamily)
MRQSHPTIAAEGAALEKSEAACRQLASRARAEVREQRPRGATVATGSGEIDPKHQQLLSAFSAATQAGGPKRPDTWWRPDFSIRFATVNGLPGVIVDSPEGPVQTAAVEIEGGLVRAVYVVRNPDKLRHLARGRS